MARELPTRNDIYMMLLQSMDSDTAGWFADAMHDFVVTDVKECADEEYNDDDVRLAIGRYFRRMILHDEI